MNMNPREPVRVGPGNPAAAANASWARTIRALQDPQKLAEYAAFVDGTGSTLPADIELLDGEAPRALRAAYDQQFKQMQALNDRAHAEGRDLNADESRLFDRGNGVLNKIGDLITLNEQAKMSMDQASAGSGGGSRDYVPNRPLAKGQTFLGAVRAQDPYDETPEDLSIGKIVKAMITGDWRGADREAASVKNAMSGAGAGGVLLPTVTSASIIDLARNKTRVLEAGAQIVPMNDRTVVVPRWTGDPAMAWRAENAAIAEVDGSMDAVTLTAKSLAAIVRISRELVEDTDVEAVVREAIASALAVKWDYAGLYGAGTNEPTGIKVNAGVTKTSLGANGATPTWDNLIDGVGRLRDNNEEPTAQIMADRTLRTLSKIKEGTTNAYMAPPSYLSDVPRLTTNQVPVNLTVGTSSDTSDLFTGDFRQLYMGVRTSPLVIQLSERYADSGQIGLLVWFRGDIQVARSKAFDVVTGVRP
jgi:HK97 family phage major capsid protein